MSLSVHAGEICGLAGHNGAGKSTSLGLVTGSVPLDKPGYCLFSSDKFERANVNNAWVAGHSVREEVGAIRRTLGYCPQFNTNVFQELTVRQNLLFQCRSLNIPYYDHARLVESALRRVGLAAWGDRQLRELSGGMQRRVSIAMAILSPKARLIVLDEPSTGLDPQTKRVIWAVVRDVARTPRKSPLIVGAAAASVRLHRLHEPRPGVVMTSHDMDELSAISDKVVILADGQVVTQGSALELRARYGAGFSLNVSSGSAEACEDFVQEFKGWISGARAAGVAGRENLANSEEFEDSGESGKYSQAPPENQRKWEK